MKEAFRWFLALVGAAIAGALALVTFRARREAAANARAARVGFDRAKAAEKLEGDDARADEVATVAEVVRERDAVLDSGRDAVVAEALRIARERGGR